MTLPVLKPTREEMSRCIAYYQTIRGAIRPDGNNVAKPVLGYLAPGDAKWILPEKRDEIPSIVQAAGFCVYFVECVPGSGCEMHNHDSTETFLILEGTWKVQWEGEAGIDSVVLNKYDMFSFPRGVARRFVNLTVENGKQVGILLAIVGGNQPIAEPCEEAHARLQAANVTVATDNDLQ
jgi:mannose-6-phosphate isomerase-like protein (cupin superfamily)